MSKRQTTTKTRKRDSTRIDERLVKALAHPLRVQALTILNERVASPIEISRELGESLGNVSYHVRILEDLGCIELVRTEPRRGALEHYYRALLRPWFTKRDWSRIPTSARQGVSGALLTQITDEIAGALEAGRFDRRPDRHLSRSAPVVDEQGWREIAELLDDVLERVFEIQNESAIRIQEAGDPDAGIPARVVLLHYESAEGDGKPPKRSTRGPKPKPRT